MNTQDYFFVRSNKTIYKIKISDLIFIESKGDYVLIKTTQHSLVVHITMQSMLKKSSKLIRVHRSFAIALENIDTVKVYSSNSGVMIKSSEVPIGAGYKKAFLKLLNI